MVKRNLNYSSYLAPRYWPMWLALGLAYLIAHLPLRVQYSLGALLGHLGFHTFKSRRKVTETNIAHCFPELSSAQQQRLVRQSFRANGIGLIEALRSWYRDPECLRHRVDYQGQEHLDAALAKGKGVILLGGHYSTLDLAGGLTTLFFEADVLQRDHANGLFNAFMTRSRQRLYETVLDKHDVRGMLRCLKRNRIVWYATDQDPGRKHSVFVPFFGLPSATLVSTMKLAKASGAAVLPFSHFRDERNGRYQVIVHPALEAFPSEDLEQDATRLNSILEAEIREAPEQYLWMHRRFKTPPQPGSQNIYGQCR